MMRHATALEAPGMAQASSRDEREREGELTGAVIRRVIEAFYAKVRQDALLGPVFDDIVEDWDAHIDKVSAFWRCATRLDRTYNSRDFIPAHVGHAQIRPSLLPQWLLLFRRTATEMCTEEIAEVLIDIAGRMAESIEMSLARRDRPTGARDVVRHAGEAERADLESLIREDYERCHPGETLEDLKRRASFSKEDKGLYRDWLAVAARRAAAASAVKRGSNAPAISYPGLPVQ